MDEAVQTVLVDREREPLQQGEHRAEEGVGALMQELLRVIFLGLLLDELG